MYALAHIYQCFLIVQKSDNSRNIYNSFRGHGLCDRILRKFRCRKNIVFLSLVTIKIAPVQFRLCYPSDELVGEVAARSGRSTVFCPSPAVVNEWRPTAAKGMVRRRWRRSLKLKFLFLAALHRINLYIGTTFSGKLAAPT